MVGAWTVALFFTGWKHAGENLAEVLKQRARPGWPKRIVFGQAGVTLRNGRQTDL
jgi:hypothetical protein